MDSFGEDLFASASLKEYRARHNSSNADNRIDPAFLNSHGGIHQDFYSQDGQDVTTYQYPTMPDSLKLRYINRSQTSIPRQPTEQPRPSQNLSLDPSILLGGSTPREGHGYIPTITKKRDRNQADSADELEEPPAKSRRLMRQPLNPSRRGPQGNNDLCNGSQGSEEARMAPPKPTQRKRATRTKTNKYKTNGDEGENEKEKENRERKISKYNQKVAEGKGPEKGSLGPKGEVRIRDGQMEFKDVNNPEWTLAAYHCEFRRQFLDKAAEAGGFDQEPIRGEADDDETSFEPEQQSWGPSRNEDWHNIVNSSGDKVMFQVEKPANRRPPQEPGNWIHDGYVLLDSKNHPIKNWPGLNKTLSSEIENWRWEAIMRVYPWLTVADLMARMPHTRKKNGQVLPLQTSQAFTNRALRLRIPNQMPTARPKNGSAAYKKEILRNLAEKNAKTTEDLPTLKQSQIAKVRKANEGKFDENSRYVVKKKEGSTAMPPPPSSRKRKANHDNDTVPEEPLEAPVVKRQRIQTPYQMGLETPGPNDQTWGSLSDDVDADAYWEGANVYNAPPNSATVGNEQTKSLSPAQSTSHFQDHYENGLVLLFSTIIDRQHALAISPSFTSPAAVKRAREEEGWKTDFINVDWYKPDVPRYVNPNDGSIVEGVAHMDAYDQIVFLGGFHQSQATVHGNDAYDAPSSLAQGDGVFNDNSQGTFQDSGFYNATPSFAQDDGAFDDDNQGPFHGDDAYNATPPLAQGDSAFNNNSQATFHGDSAYNTTPSFTQDIGTSNEDSQANFNSDGVYKAMPWFAQDDNAFDGDSQAISDVNGAYDATQYAHDDGTFDATSTLPQGDLPSDFNPFFNQNDFGGNPNPLPQIPTNPLPALQTRSEG